MTGIPLTTLNKIYFVIPKQDKKGLHSWISSKPHLFEVKKSSKSNTSSKAIYKNRIFNITKNNWKPKMLTHDYNKFRNKNSFKIVPLNSLEVSGSLYNKKLLKFKKSAEILDSIHKKSSNLKKYNNFLNRNKDYLNKSVDYKKRLSKDYFKVINFSKNFENKKDPLSKLIDYKFRRNGDFRLGYSTPIFRILKNKEELIKKNYLSLIKSQNWRNNWRKKFKRKMLYYYPRSTRLKRRPLSSFFYGENLLAMDRKLRKLYFSSIFNKGYKIRDNLENEDFLNNKFNLISYLKKKDLNNSLSSVDSRSFYLASRKKRKSFKLNYQKLKDYNKKMGTLDFIDKSVKKNKNSFFLKSFLLKPKFKNFSNRHNSKSSTDMDETNLKEKTNSNESINNNKSSQSGNDELKKDIILYFVNGKKFNKYKITKILSESNLLKNDPNTITEVGLRAALKRKLFKEYEDRRLKIESKSRSLSSFENYSDFLFYKLNFFTNFTDFVHTNSRKFKSFLKNNFFKYRFKTRRWKKRFFKRWKLKLRWTRKSRKLKKLNYRFHPKHYSRLKQKFMHIAERARRSRALFKKWCRVLRKKIWRAPPKKKFKKEKRRRKHLLRFLRNKLSMPYIKRKIIQPMGKINLSSTRRLFARRKRLKFLLKKYNPSETKHPKFLKNETYKFSKFKFFNKDKKLIDEILKGKNLLDKSELHKILDKNELGEVYYQFTKQAYEPKIIYDYNKDYISDYVEKYLNSAEQGRLYVDYSGKKKKFWFLKNNPDSVKFLFNKSLLNKKNKLMFFKYRNMFKRKPIEKKSVIFTKKFWKRLKKSKRYRKKIYWPYIWLKTKYNNWKKNLYGLSGLRHSLLTMIFLPSFSFILVLLLFSPKLWFWPLVYYLKICFGFFFFFWLYIYTNWDPVYITFFLFIIYFRSSIKSWNRKKNKIKNKIKNAKNSK